MSHLAMLTLLVAAILPVVTCYSTGAPPDGCWTERPLHGDFLPIPTWPPFVLEVEKLNKSIPDDVYRPREVMKVTIRSTDGTPFKGYLIKVVSSNGVTKGNWRTRKLVQKYIPLCGVTHTRADNYTSVSIMWRAPRESSMKTIQFRAIVVQDKENFYNNILSQRMVPDYPVPDQFMKMWAKWNALLDFNFTSPTNDLSSSVQQVSSLITGALDAARTAGVAKTSDVTSTTSGSAVPAVLDATATKSPGSVVQPA